MKKLTLFFISSFATSIILAQDWTPRHPSWTDSFQANGFCWCNSTNFDHGLDTKTLELNGTDYNIVDVCDELESHPLYRAYQDGDAPYNDIQCGNGPANDAADETGCPGRTDLGSDGCYEIGPTFDVEWLESRSRFGGDDTSTPVTGGSTIVHITKGNATGFALDGDGGAVNAQNVYLWSENENNVNQQWIEIDRGNGYYSYQKVGTNHCIDGDGGGENRQNVYLWTCGENNQNQHWLKVSTADGTFRLEKRNAPGYSIDGNGGGASGQNVYLWSSNNNNQNQQWYITPIGTSAKSIADLGVNNGSNILVYPNPVEYFATISVNSIESVDNITYSISDISGKIIKQINSSETIQTIDLRDVSSGVYLIEVNTGLRKEVRKLIKQ